MISVTMVSSNFKFVWESLSGPSGPECPNSRTIRSHRIEADVEKLSFVLVRGVTPEDLVNSVFYVLS